MYFIRLQKQFDFKKYYIRTVRYNLPKLNQCLSKPHSSKFFNMNILFHNSWGLANDEKLHIFESALKKIIKTDLSLPERRRRQALLIFAL